MRSGPIPLPTLYRTLLRAYGPQGWWPVLRPATARPPGKRAQSGQWTMTYDPAFTSRPRTPKERFEIAVGAILTQNTAWANVEKALCSLKEQRLLDPAKLARARLPRLARAIRSSGYHTQKARKLRILSCFARSKKPWTRADLLALWGVGPETADSILLYALQQPLFVIDAYTRRALRRLGLAKGDEPYEELQALFHRALPADPALFNEFHALLVKLGKSVCAPVPRCPSCPLRPQCPTGQQAL